MTNLTFPVRLDPNSAPDETLHVTVGGWAARIYATDAGGGYPVHGAVFIGGEWLPRAWTSDGFFHHPGVDSPFDLRDRPKAKRGVWVAWFADEDGRNFLRSYATQAEADSAKHKWATLRGVVYIKEGDGLDTPADPPLWVDWAMLPEWAKWAAADEEGSVWFYSEKPLPGERIWGPGSADMRAAPLAKHLYRLAPGFKWQETMIQRPEDV